MYFTIIFLVLPIFGITVKNNLNIIENQDTTLERNGKFIGFWGLGFGVGVVRFANNACNSSSSLVGTCYTKRQCADIGGIASGSCASNIGVCCVIQLGCGATSSYNNTYFVNTNFPSTVTGTGSDRCVYTIKQCNSDICQVRIDFISATLAQPDGDGNCRDDSLTIIGGGSQVPVLCGENTGQHVYVDFYQSQDIQIIVTTSAAQGSNRNWNFKVTQIGCDCPTKAPSGCLQYHTELSGTVQSFNYGSTGSSSLNNIGAVGTRQLVNQNYGICVAMRPGYCSITWTPSSMSSFTVSGDTDGVQMLIGTPAAGIMGENCTSDFVVIPAPFVNNVLQNYDRFCGNYFPPVTTYSKPFVLTVYTNGNETNDVANRGFSLNYQQNRCTMLTNIEMVG
ncbi:uncharacterized protein [Onthophagus taurus]|uniref:uncharacterized protein n=1 Tax=Onthophagus taurus TaxID=166361 RepID=UPI0039BE91C6